MNTTTVNKMHSADSTDHMGEVLLRQRAAFLRDAPPDLNQRKADLRKLKSVVLAHQEEIAKAIGDDFGHRSSHETAIMEMVPLVGAINYQLGKLRRWLRPEKRHVPMHFQPGRAWIKYQPLGVVGIMSPWNYPLQLALVPLATALAAGNRVMLKPSEFTPATNALMVKMLRQSFSEEQVAVITGEADVARAFSALPFDHLVFTGSTLVGRAVMRAASEHLVPVTLELGGKSPVIIDKGSPMGHAATSVAFGKLINAGQTCIAPDYVLVHEDDLQTFVQAYDAAVGTLYPAGPMSDNYTSIINQRQHLRLSGLLEDARAKGATVRQVGVNPGTTGLRVHNMPPAVVLNATDEMQIMREEIFGPLLPVVAYRNIDQAIAYVNARPRPLALYFFGDDGAHRRKVLALTTSGNVTINNTLLHVAHEDLPFGGVGPSGMGAYHGIEGFKALSHAKGVFQQGTWNLSRLLLPPFGPLADAVVKFMLR